MVAALCPLAEWEDVSVCHIGYPERISLHAALPYQQEDWIMPDDPATTVPFIPNSLTAQ